jgi:predicted restriction endonuclease
MKKYTKEYFKYFGYGIEDFVPCEVCGSKAVDIAHIVAQSKFGSKRKDEQDLITNIAALCRTCHYDYDFKNKWTTEEMIEIHLNYLKLWKSGKT